MLLQSQQKKSDCFCIPQTSHSKYFLYSLKHMHSIISGQQE